jgi:hypothetical protein
MKLFIATITALLVTATLAQAQFGGFGDRRTCTTVPDGRGGYVTTCN